MMLIRGMLPKNILWSLYAIASGKFDQFWGTEFIISTQPEFSCFYASRNFGEDNFRELFVLYWQVVG